MKNLLFGLIATVMFGVLSFGQDKVVPKNVLDFTASVAITTFTPVNVNATEVALTHLLISFENYKLNSS